MSYRKRSSGYHKRVFWLVGGIFLLVGLAGFYCGIGEGFEGMGNKAGLGGNTSLAAQLSEVNYPKSLLELLERNPETKQFVLDYPKKKSERGQIDISGEVTKGEIPLFLQWDERWGYRKYGGDFMALNGCGPTCLSMVYCGLSGETDWNPFRTAQMAEQEGYYVSGTGTSWELMTGGADSLGLTVEQVTFSENGIRSVLEAGKPIICVVGVGDFTTTGHFLVLTGVDTTGNIQLCDPNSRKNSEQTWELERLMSQIRNLWAYSYPG